MKPDTICVYCGTDLEEVKRLRSQLCRAKEAIRLSLTVGTAYPRDSLARMDTHTQEALEAILSSSAPCPHAAIAERVKNVEGMAKMLYAATEGLDSEMGRWADTFDDLNDDGKRMWKQAAKILVAGLKEG